MPEQSSPIEPRDAEAAQDLRSVPPNVSVAETAMKLATEIVVAYIDKQTVAPHQLASLIKDVRDALTGSVLIPAVAMTEVASALQEDVQPEPVKRSKRSRPVERSLQLAVLEPAVPIETSVQQDYIVSLEDGQRFRSLRRHLMAKYGLSPADYREKWGLPEDYPMVAPSYAKERSEVAKRSGLGKVKSTAPAPVAKRRSEASSRGTKEH